MKKELFVNELKNIVKERIKEPFFLKSITEVPKEKSYYKVILTDKTGEIDCRVWQESLDPNFLNYEDMFVLVEGMVSEYDEKPQIIIEKMTPIKKSNIDLEEFCPKVENIEELKEELISIIHGIQKPHLRSLLENFFCNEKFLNVFCMKQAATHIHHVSIGGLLEHTLNVANLCILAVEFYQRRKPNYFHEGFDLEVLITAALLHDIGKVKEYQSFPINKKTRGGRLVGHLSYGVSMVYAAIRELDVEFPEIDQEKLLHCLNTHHGTADKTIEPMVTEAVMLSRFDEADARIDSVESAIAKDTTDDEFTSFNRTMGMFIFKG